MKSSYGISPIQKQFWVQHQSDQKSAAYNMASLFEISGFIDKIRVRNALETLIERHDILRTVYKINDGKISAFIHKEMPLSFEEKTFTQEGLISDINEPFDLECGPLFRTILYPRSKGCFLLFLFHHIAIDLHSKDIFGREFSLLYNQSGRDTGLPSTQSYSLYSEWGEENSSSDKWERMRSFWKKETESLSPLILPYDGERPAVVTTRGTRVVGALKASLFSFLNRFCKKNQSDPFIVLLAAYAVVLNKFSGQNRISIGVPRTNRESPQFENIMGCFVNILPLIVDFEPEMSLRDIIVQVRRKMLLIHRNQYLPYTDVIPLNPQGVDRKYNSLFQVGFTNEYPMEISLDGLTAEPLPVPGHGSQLDLFLYFWERNGVFHWELEYNSDLFHKDRIAFFIESYKTVLNSILNRADSSVKELPLLSSRTEELLFNSWQGKQVPRSESLCIHHYVEKQAEINGEDTALIYKGCEISFRILNERANELASLLMEKGVGRESIVGVSLERSFEMVIALLGILKAGGAYLPMEPTHPREYKKYLVDDAQLSIILTKRKYHDDLTELGCPIDLVYLEELPHDRPFSNPQGRVDMNNRCYVFYTSGSTGKPKGVDIIHEGLTDRILWMDRTFQFGRKRRTILKTPYNFDVSGMEFWLPLMTGAPLFIAEPGGHLDNTYLVRTMRDYKISISHFVPSLLKTFLKTADYQKCPDLKDVICCGEALPSDVVNEFYTKFPESRLHNLYGPTEATIFITYWACENHVSQVPIGRPVENTETFIIDEKGNLLPPGVTGELYLGGVGLARGYMNNKDLTEAAFIPQPWNRDKIMYKTGDLAQWTPWGDILYLGRNDNQIQLHGQRVELGEIENTINSHPAVEGAVLNVSSDFGSEQRLIAYIVKKGNVTSQELSSHIGNTLPKYMIPSFYFFLDKFELNSNGKLDRKKLPDPESVMGDSSPFIIAPESDTERVIARTWENILGRPVDRGQTFFEMGGSSLQLMEMQQELSIAMGRDVPIAVLFDHTTLEQLGKYFDTELAPDRMGDAVLNRAEKQKMLVRNRRRV